MGRGRPFLVRLAALALGAGLALTLVACGSGDDADFDSKTATLDLVETVKGMLFTIPTALEPLDIETLDFRSTAKGSEYTDVVGCPAT